MNVRFLFSQRGIFMNRNIISTLVDLDVSPDTVCSFAGYSSHSNLKHFWKQARYLIPSYFITFLCQIYPCIDLQNSMEITTLIKPAPYFFTGKVPMVRRLSSDRELRFPQVYSMTRIIQLISLLKQRQVPEGNRKSRALKRTVFVRPGCCNTTWN